MKIKIYAAILKVNIDTRTEFTFPKIYSKHPFMRSVSRITVEVRDKRICIDTTFSTVQIALEYIIWAVDSTVNEMNVEQNEIKFGCKIIFKENSKDHLNEQRMSEKFFIEVHVIKSRN